MKTKKLNLIRSGAAATLFVLAVSLASTIIGPGQAQAAIALVGSNTATTTTGTTATTLALTKPAGVISGTVMVVHLTYNAGANKGVTVTKPTGWLQAGGYVSNGNWWQSVFYKVAGGSEPTSYTFTISRASNIVGGILAYSGVDNTAPIDDVIGYTSGATNTTTHSAPSASASTNGDMMVNFWGYLTATTATSYDASLTANYSVSTTNVGDASAGKVLNNAGVTGTFNSFTAGNTKWLAHTVLLLPSSRPAGISFVSSATTFCASCSNLSLTSPAGWSAGDFFIVSVLWNSAATLTAPNSSWVQIGSTQVDGAYSQAVFYHVADISDPSSYSWLFSTATNVIIAGTDYAGVDVAAPVDDTQTANDASGSNHIAPSVTSTHSNDYYVGIWGFEANFIGSTTSFSSTLNSAWNLVDGTTLGSDSMYEPLGNAGASGTRFTTSVNPSNNAQLRNTRSLMRSIALKPFIPIPKLYIPVDQSTGAPLYTVFQVKDYLINPGPEKYKIELCSNSTCTTILSTYDQTSSQTGWSGQDVSGATAYNGTSALSTSTMATYTLQTPLTANTQYWWRAYAYDVNGGYFTPPSNISSFKTSVYPAAPTLFQPGNGASNVPLNPEFRLAATDADGDDLQYKIQLCSTATCSTVLYTFDQTSSQAGWSGQDNATFTAYGSDPTLASNSTPAFYDFTSANLAQNTQYWWRAYAIDPAGTNTFSAASAISSFTTNLTETRIIEGRILGSKIL
ncbi:MAG: hypothetical protein QFB87_03930 [Patescibacteria group bacterium]|nr:hypothetical protein [Patescibacteria group bacterium]